MKNTIESKTRAAALAASLMLALAAPAHAQSNAAVSSAPTARSRNFAGSVVESVRTGKVIAPDGAVAITSIDRKWDDQSGTGTINEAAVTPDGKISTREANLTRDLSGTITAKGTFTDFDGRSANYTETEKRTAAGIVVVGQLVDEDGKTATYETTSSRNGRNETKLTTVFRYADGAKVTRVELLNAPRRVAGS